MGFRVIGGHEKEPGSHNGPRPSGRMPQIHSHAIRAPRKLSAFKKGRKK